MCEAGDEKYVPFDNVATLEGIQRRALDQIAAAEFGALVLSQLHPRRQIPSADMFLTPDLVKLRAALQGDANGLIDN